jgi:hypothetical protein
MQIQRLPSAVRTCAYLPGAAALFMSEVYPVLCSSLGASECVHLSDTYTTSPHSVTSAQREFVLYPNCVVT